MLERLQFPGSIDALDLVIAADGTPVEFTFHATAKPVSGGMAGLAVDMRSDVRLSKIGEPIRIRPPK